MTVDHAVTRSGVATFSLDAAGQNPVSVMFHLEIDVQFSLREYCAG